MIAFRPLGNRIFVRRDKPKEKVTKGGVVLPETTDHVANQGVVVAVGRGMRNSEGERIPLEIQVDDHVIFNGFGASEVEVGEERLLNLPEDAVLAFLREGDDG